MNEEINYIFDEGIIKRQQIAEKKMLEEYEKGEFTFETPLICLNPYLISPCSAVILFRTEKPVAIKLTVQGKTQETNIAHTFKAEISHVIPVLGLYPDYENTVEISLYQGESRTFQIITKPIERDIAKLIYMKSTANYLKNGELIFLSPALTDRATGFDANGDVRWHISIPTVFDIKRLKNGRILTGTERLIQIPYYMSGLYEMDLVGKIYKVYTLDGGYHHDQVEMPNGDLLVLTDDFATGTLEDVAVLLDRETGVVKKTWRAKDFLVPGMGKSGSWSDEDWFHCNAIWYDENTNSLTLSGRHMDIICNIDFESGELNWILGDPTGWDKTWVDRYFFTPIGEKFEWQYEQHSALITPNGDVMCFDNGHYRSKIVREYRLNRDNYSRGVRYKIDTKAMTIEQVWQYGKERGTEFFSDYISNVEWYADNHYMVHSGGIQFYDGEVSEEFIGAKKGDPLARGESITVEILGDEVMLELKVEGNFYRAEKLSLYHENSNLELKPVRQLGNMGVSAQSETVIEMPLSGKMMPEKCKAHIIDEKDRFTLKSRFERGQLVMLMMENENETHSYYIPTSAHATRLSALCCGTFIESDDRNTSTSINKRGLSGEFDIRVIIDDEKYETGIKITC